MRWKHATFEDLESIDMGDSNIAQDVRGMLDDDDATRAILDDNGRALVDGSRVLAIVGLWPMWEGVGMVWTLITPEAREHGVLLSLGVARMLRMAEQKKGYRRIQASVERGDEIARKWIVGLGFGYEGTMRGYAPDGATHDMYARLR